MTRRGSESDDRVLAEHTLVVDSVGSNINIQINSARLVFAFLSSPESNSWFAIALNDKEGSESHDRVLAEHTLVVNRYQYPGQQCAAWCSAPFLT